MSQSMGNLGWDPLSCKAGLLWVSLKCLQSVGGSARAGWSRQPHSPGWQSWASSPLFSSMRSLQQLAQVLASLLEDDVCRHRQHIIMCNYLQTWAFALFLHVPLAKAGHLAMARFKRARTRLHHLGRMTQSQY